MTKNTTKYAMFAVAAVAAMSFGFTPAFAASYTQDVDTTADNYAYENDSECNGSNLITRVTPYSSQDYVKVVVDGDACSSFNSVTVTVWVDGTWEGSVTTSSDYKTLYFQQITGMTVGDDVEVRSVWNY